MKKEITRKDGTVFQNQGAAAIALQQQGIKEFYDIVIHKDGFICRLKDDKKAVAAARKTYRVYRSNVDPDNKDIPISINANTPAGKKQFAPGQEVELTATQISILKNAVEETMIQIPLESGIYTSNDPQSLAKNLYPSMTPQVNLATGEITMIDRSPNFIIESVSMAA